MSIWSTSSTRWVVASPENDIRLLKHRGRRGTQKRSFAAFLLEAGGAHGKLVAGKRGAGAHCVPGGTPAGHPPRRVPAALPPERAPPGFVYKFCSSSGVPCPAAIFGNIEALFSGANKKRRAKALRCRILWITQYPYILSRCLLPAWANRCAGRSSSGSY